MMKNQMAGLMQAAQKMKETADRVQAELASTEVEGQSGAGMVKVLMTCKHDVRRVSIDPSLVGDDKDMLEDLVAAAFNDAARRSRRCRRKDVCDNRRHAAAARHEITILMRTRCTRRLRRRTCTSRGLMSEPDWAAGRPARYQEPWYPSR
jgi:DNA-binding YbaB/EbfC family protein